LLGVGLGWFAWEWTVQERTRQQKEVLENFAKYRTTVEWRNGYVVGLWFPDRTGKGGPCDEDLENLEGLTGLETLGFDSDNVTDRGLAHIGKAATLKTLGFYSRNATDDGLEHLKSLTNLQELWVVARVSGDGLLELQKALPNCHVGGHDPSGGPDSLHDWGSF